MKDPCRKQTLVLVLAGTIAVSGCGAMTGGILGAVVDRGNPWRGAVIGGAAGAAVDMHYNRQQRHPQGGGYPQQQGYGGGYARGAQNSQCGGSGPARVFLEEGKRAAEDGGIIRQQSERTVTESNGYRICTGFDRTSSSSTTVVPGAGAPQRGPVVRFFDDEFDVWIDGSSYGGVFPQPPTFFQ